MATPAKQYYLNGKDLWLVFGVMLLKGSTNDFLRYPDKKDSIEHDWMDSNGLDVNLNRVYVKSKEIDLKCFMVGNSESDFWSKYHGFFAEWLTPDVKRFTVSEFESSYFVYYKSCSNPERYTPIKATTKIIYTFGLTIIQNNPVPSTDVFLISDDGRFIVT